MALQFLLTQSATIKDFVLWGVKARLPNGTRFVEDFGKVEYLLAEERRVSYPIAATSVFAEMYRTNRSFEQVWPAWEDNQVPIHKPLFQGNEIEMITNELVPDWALGDLKRTMIKLMNSDAPLEIGMELINLYAKCQSEGTRLSSFCHQMRSAALQSRDGDKPDTVDVAMGNVIVLANHGSLVSAIQFGHRAEWDYIVRLMQACQTIQVLALALERSQRWVMKRTLWSVEEWRLLFIKLEHIPPSSEGKPVIEVKSVPQELMNSWWKPSDLFMGSKI